MKFQFVLKSMTLNDLERSKQSKRILQSPKVFHWDATFTFIPQYSNIPHRSDTLLWPSLKLSVWKLFIEGSSTLFFVTPPPSIFLHCRWLTFHLFKQDAWISLSVFQKHLSTWQVTIITPPSPTPSRPSCDIPAQDPTVYLRPSLRTNCSTVSYALLHFQ